MTRAGAAVIALATLVLSGARAHAAGVADTCPPWMRQAAAQPLTHAQETAPAVVLFDERTTTVSDDGTVVTRHLYAARIGSLEGRAAASFDEVYLTDTGRIRQARGWIIRQSGEVREIGKEYVADVALAVNDVYNEARARVVTAGDPEPGMIFGAEIDSEDRSVFTQFEWPLQQRWPVKNARRSLTVPRGWRVTSVTFNREPIAPAVTGSSYVWELTDLPGLDEEPAMPPRSASAPRLAVTYVPERAAPALPTFSDWKEVGRWLASLSDAAAQPDAALTAKARELTAGLASDLDKIRAIGAYVQRVPYISIQIGVGRGGGYRPRPASQVFARNHGDCKDKANLMRAMLAAVGIKSFLVSAYAGDRDYVREEWPSPQQFNHCIIAVALASGGPPGPAVVSTQAHGRLLIVDPTAQYTVIGTLPEEEQASLALLIAADGGGLIRLPEGAPDSNALERVVEGTVAPDGSFAASVREVRVGEEAAAERAARASLGNDDYKRYVERFVVEDMGATVVSSVAAGDAGDRFERTMRVAAAGYAQVIEQRLLVFKPPFRGTRALPVLSSPTRVRPICLDAIHTDDVLRLDTPPGFDVDELPPPATIDTKFGRYTVTATAEGPRVVVERRLQVRRATVPAADYQALRAFLDSVRAADTSPVVFRRR